MIEAVGLTSSTRKGEPSVVEDVSFEARAGHVTALLGAPGAGKTTALRLMLSLQQGRGLTYFRGRPLHRIAHPSREVGVLLGDVPGHPARSVRGQLRMLCAAAGVSVRRADEVLEAVGLVSLREERLGTLSLGMDRRLGIAAALLPDPHTLILDEPTAGLSAGEVRWTHTTLRTYAAQGGTVLFTTADPKEAAGRADHVVTLDAGRVVADQEGKEFARTRLRPRVAVRTPHAERLATLLTQEARTERRSVEVVREGGNRISVYGSTTADIGEAAFRHGILVHQLADEVGDMGPGGGVDPVGETEPAAPEAVKEQRPAVSGLALVEQKQAANRSVPGQELARVGGGKASAAGSGASDASDASDHGVRSASGDSASASAGPTEDPSRDSPQEAGADPEPRDGTPRPAQAARRDVLSPLPPPISVRSTPGPLRPLRYELRRAAGVRAGFLAGGAVLLVSALTAVLLARIGHTPQERLFAAWPRGLPLPPAALGAGLLGALAFGDEFRHPALAVERAAVPRRLGLLVAKLFVSGATAALLAFLTLGCDAEALYLLYGRELVRVPGDWLPLSASWLGLVTGCAWAGVLAAGVFRSTTAGLAAVLAVPVAVVPLVHKVLAGSSVRTAAGLTERMREVLLLQWPFGGDRYVLAALRIVAQPVGAAMALSLAVLLGAYLFTAPRLRVR